MTNAASAFPGVVGLLVLVALLVWLGVAARGRARVLALVGVGLELLAILVSVLLGIALPTIRQSFELSIGASVLLLTSTSALLSTSGIVLLVIAVVTASRSTREPQVRR